MFNNKRPAGTPATGTKQAPFSLIGGDVVLTGSITASVDLHVDGRIEGDVSCAALVQGADSVIRGNITAKTARVAGTIEGGVTADELVVERGARITGDCSYGSLQVEVGAAIEGRMSPRSATAPTLKVIAAAE
ncbi:bactofilin family protein [Sphingomonas sp.]|uniref:bactofilin family protein n=1 Tax=Sphingomonas sp. TaxID=28214 RepID=UPI002DD65747|nr:polymer-forming cytoskeletal protein [Sphingomonas sp.]